MSNTTTECRTPPFVLDVPVSTHSKESLACLPPLQARERSNRSSSPLFTLPLTVVRRKKPLLGRPPFAVDNDGFGIELARYRHKPYITRCYPVSFSGTAWLQAKRQSP